VTGSRIYHVGIVVPALEPAMEQLSAATGITWGRQQRDIPVTYNTLDGQRTWNPSFVMSKEPPHLELLEQLEGSIWAELGFHHLGMWSDDVHRDSTAIEGQGCIWQAATESDEGIRLGACYHAVPAASCRVELVSKERSGPRLARYLSGGDYS
jgi:hypothetical protein